MKEIISYYTSIGLSTSAEQKTVKTPGILATYSRVGGVNSSRSGWFSVEHFNGNRYISQ